MSLFGPQRQARATCLLAPGDRVVVADSLGRRQSATVDEVSLLGEDASGVPIYGVSVLHQTERYFSVTAANYVWPLSWA